MNEAGKLSSMCRDSVANPCEPPYLHYMEGAQGWLELGDARSALHEIRRIDADLKNHPDVLLLTWDIQAALRNWDEAYKIGDCLVKVIPDDLQSWLNRSESIMHKDTTEAAYEAYQALRFSAKTISSIFGWLGTPALAAS
jgi:hypothetical protein